LLLDHFAWFILRQALNFLHHGHGPNRIPTLNLQATRRELCRLPWLVHDFSKTDLLGIQTLQHKHNKLTIFWIMWLLWLLFLFLLLVDFSIFFSGLQFIQFSAGKKVLCWLIDSKMTVNLWSWANDYHLSYL
jgi:hypothetical protein